MPEKSEPSPEQELSEVEVRHATPEDLNGIISVEENMRKISVEKGRKDFVPMGNETISLLNKDLAEDQSGKMIFLVARLEGGVCGFTLIKRNIDTYKDSKPLDDRTATVLGITVHGDYQQKGIATNLLQEGISEAQRLFGVKRIELQTDEDNVARGLYEKLGFKEIPVDPTRHTLTKKRKDKAVRRISYEKWLE